MILDKTVPVSEIPLVFEKKTKELNRERFQTAKTIRIKIYTKSLKNPT